MMIVNLRKNETLRIGDTWVTFIRRRDSKGFELGVKAPPSKPIYREEVYAVLKKEKECLLQQESENNNYYKKG